MEHFDDMLRNTLANDYPENRFEFREEYWHQAQALIESYERKRKRRTIFWVFTGLLLTTAAVLYFYDGSQPAEKITPDAQPAVQQTLQAPMAVQQNATTGTNNQAQHTSTTSKNDTSPEQVTADITNHASNTGKASKNTSSYTPSNINNTVQERIPDIISGNNTSTASTSGSSQKTALQTPQPGYQPDAIIPSPQQPGAVNTTTAPGRVTILASKRIQSPAFQSVNSISPAPKPVLALVPASTDVMAASSSIIKKANENKWHAGVTLLTGNSEKILSKEHFSLGLGIANQFRFNHKWSLSADLLWRRRNAPSQFVPSNLPVSNNADAIVYDEQVTTYSFGYYQTHTTTTLEATHFAEIPVYVSRHFGKWAIDAGAMVTTPLLSKTHTERNESSSLNKIATTTADVTKYESNVEQIGNSILPGLIAGINFEPFRNLSIGMRGTYTLSQNNYTLSFSTIDQEPLKLNRSLSPFSADIRVKWLF